MSAKHDWTTDGGIVAGLQDRLRIVGYGTAFQIYRGRALLDEDAARQAVIEAVVGPPVLPRYKDTLQRMMGADDNPDYYEVDMQAGPDGLVFEHGDFRGPIDLADGLQVSSPTGKATRRQRQIEERAEALGQKREKIRYTSEEDYLIHAAQCGYLFRNTLLDFLHSPKMQGTSVKMKIYNLRLDQLQRFIDATGSPTLAALSTHEGTRPGSDDDGKYTHSGWIGFALEVIDFLNLELVIDIDALKAQHRDVGGDTGFRTLEAWGAHADTVLGQLTDRRPDIDGDMIREFFMEGRNGTLFMDQDDSDDEAQVEYQKVAGVS